MNAQPADRRAAYGQKHEIARPLQNSSVAAILFSVLTCSTAGRGNRLFRVADDAEQPLIGLLGDVDRQRLLIEGSDIAPDHVREQAIQRAVRRVRRRKLQGLVLKGSVGPQTRVLADEPVVQFGQGVPSLLARRNSQLYHGPGHFQWFWRVQNMTRFRVYVIVSPY